MPPINYNYAEFAKKGKAGHRATMEHADIISRLNEETTTTGFGVPVFQGTTDRGVVTDVGAVGDFVGITVFDGMAFSDVEMTFEGFATKTMMSVMRHGTMWVDVTAAVNAGDPVHILAGGTFGATGGVALPNARYETSTTAAGLAQIKF